MIDDEVTFHPEETPMDVIQRVLGMLGDNIDRILIVTMDTNGNHFHMVSNARSAAEENGMCNIISNWVDHQG